jgi:hypothetical protein
MLNQLGGRSPVQWSKSGAEKDRTYLYRHSATLVFAGKMIELMPSSK